MEEVGRRRHVRHDEIGPGTGCQQPFGPSGRMIRPTAVEPMRQEDDKTRRPQPAILAASDALVEHWLRNVEEFAELRLPHHEPARIGQAHAVFETKHRVLDERRVVDLDVV